jgi:hypothetical protein
MRSSSHVSIVLALTLAACATTTDEGDEGDVEAMSDPSGLTARILNPLGAAGDEIAAAQQASEPLEWSDWGDTADSPFFHGGGGHGGHGHHHGHSCERNKLRVNLAGDGCGFVISNPWGILCGWDCSQKYDDDETVTLYAYAIPGSVFAGWSGAGCSGTGTCTVHMDNERYVTATFTHGTPPSTRNLTVSKSGDGDGTVTSDPAGIDCGGDCSQAYTTGSSVTLTATAAAGSTFSGWTGACSGTGTCTVTMDSDKTAIANFSAVIVNNVLTVATDGDGDGTVTSDPAGIDCGLDCTEEYPPTTGVTLTATASTGSAFTGWSGGGCSGTGTCVVSMATSQSVTATFTAVYNLAVTKDGTGGGTVTSDPAGIDCGGDCSEGYLSGTTVTLTAVAAAGSDFIGWTGGGCTGTGACVVALGSDVDVNATFDFGPLLSVERIGFGDGTVTSADGLINCGADCNENYSTNTTVTLTAAPSELSSFGGWSGGGCEGLGDCTVTLDVAQTVEALFHPRGSIYTIRDNTDQTQRYDLMTSPLAAVTLGAFGFGYAFGDCTYDSFDNTIYAVEGRSTRQLFRINPTTGAGTLIGTHGIADMFALAYHPPSNTVFGIASNRNVYAMNLQTGAATLRGNMGTITGSTIDGLAYDSKRDRLIALTTSTNASVYQINPATGAGTLLLADVNPGVGLNNLGLTYDPVIDRFWIFDFDGAIRQMDPETWAITTITTGQGQHTCAAYVTF